jgi:hypothetical protein
MANSIDSALQEALTEALATPGVVWAAVDDTINEALLSPIVKRGIKVLGKVTSYEYQYATKMVFLLERRRRHAHPIKRL